MRTPKVSVITIVYNVGQYIERCARSLFEQTLDDIEYIFVNDGTSDNSFEILENVLSDYPKRKEQVRIVRLPKNSGQAAARTAGMRIASGQYQIHCDPDDWVEKDAYETMFLKALETGSDIVLCRAIAHQNHKVEIIEKTFEGTGMDCLFENHYSGALWSKLIATELIRKNNIYPFPGINNGEDLNVSIRAYLVSKKITSVNQPFYHYNKDNPGSITNIGLKENFYRYIIPNIELICDILRGVEDSRKQFFIKRLKFESKYSNLYFLSRGFEVKEWKTLWNDSHSSIRNIDSLSMLTRVFLPLFIKSKLTLIIWIKLKKVLGKKNGFGKLKFS